LLFKPNKRLISNEVLPTRVEFAVH